MCTVSLIRPQSEREPRIRVVVNRDERRTRPAALPPIVVHAGDRRATLPIDPVGPGSWVSVNDAGIALALLNGVGPGAPTAKVTPRSRGEIISQLIGCSSLRAVGTRLNALDLRVYRPWRLIAATTTDFLDIHSDAVAADLEPKPLPSVFVATSSSLLPSEAIRLRTALFEEMVTEPNPEAQDAFHRHQWRDRPHLSVRMERPEARTVSRTIIELNCRNARLRYVAVA